MRIRDGKNSDPGWKKSRIRDKHPGSATRMVWMHTADSICFRLRFRIQLMTLYVDPDKNFHFDAEPAPQHRMKPKPSNRRHIVRGLLIL
jgi:hypothetical protein